MKRNKLRAGAAIAAIALLGSMGMGGVAYASPDNEPDIHIAGAEDESADIALIKKDAQARLSIHKYLGTPVEAKNNGMPQDIENRVRLQNVKFDVYMVNDVNLTTNEGWKAAQNLHECKVSVSDVLQSTIVCKDKSFGISKAGSGLTNSFGAAKIDKLPVGLYLVVEDLAGSKDIKGEGKTYKPEQITGINPFLVTLPMTNPDSRDSWMYDVHVYPKNQAAEITKEVLDGNQGEENQDGYKIGQNITYRLESTINVVDSNQDGKVDGQDLGYYYVKDQLSDNVEHVSSTLTIVPPRGNPVLLNASDDYIFAIDKSNHIGFSLTESGLNKLAQAAGGKLRTDIVAKVSSVPADGQIKNRASFYPNNYPWTSRGLTPPKPGDTPPNSPPNTPPDVPSNEVVSKYGDIIINKVNADGKSLKGAEFAVYRATFESYAAGYTCKGVNFQADPIARTANATDDNGLAMIQGLQLSDWRNDSHEESGLIENEKEYYSYCLVETKSPDGYQLLAEPIEFDLTHEGAIADLKELVGKALKPGQGLKVVNQPDNLKNKLPLTGGQGIALISGLGVVLVGGGVGYYVYSNRRKNA